MLTKNHLLPVARALVLCGRLEAIYQPRRSFLKNKAQVSDTSFSRAGAKLGALHGSPQLGFFDSRRKGLLAFGPGAGLVVGVSIGTESLRAVLVDANGWAHVEHNAEPLTNQVSASQAEILGRVRSIVGVVLAKAIRKESLLIDESLPLLGCSVAWPTPVDRNDFAVGHALPSFRNSRLSLVRHVKNTLPIKEIEVFAINDARAAAIAVAHRETHRREPPWEHAELTIVLRLAGGIGGAIIVIEPPQQRSERDIDSGFPASILLGGADNHAGEIGHVSISQSVVDGLNADTLPGLAPLLARGCSCSDGSGATQHVEAFASAVALAQRIDADRPMHAVLEQVLNEPDNPRHARALQDVGALVGEALVAPVAMLNPFRIVLTGSLAVPAVRERIEERLATHQYVGRLPDVVVIREPENSFIRAHGAALAMIRACVYRKLHDLLPIDPTMAERGVVDLTVPLSAEELRSLYPKEVSFVDELPEDREGEGGRDRNRRPIAMALPG